VPEQRPQRQLSAILAADVAGYSRLIGLDEEGTLARLKELRRSVIDPQISEHRGRIVKTMGDGLLVQFGSAVDAVRCAVEVHQLVAEKQTGTADQRRIRFRIGINIGDIVLDGDDIFGDGVNVAARLQAFAEPGAICVSGSIYDQVRDKLDLGFVDIGEQHLKNISRPVRVYRIGDQGTGTSHLLARVDKPSIAVLPFINIGGDPEQEYFADGIVEETITALSRFHQLLVIARNSSFIYKDRAVDVKQVGRELGVRYVLEGSVRKSDRRVRIAGQLVDAETGAHLWADRFEGSLEDIFDLQDQVTANVVGSIFPKLEQAEINRSRRKPTDSLDAYDYFMRGMAAYHEWKRETNREAFAMFTRAIELDPNFASAYAMAARCYAQQKAGGWPCDRAQAMADTARLARRAAELANDDALPLSTAGFALAWVAEEVEYGNALIERALKINSNLAYAWNFSAWAKVWLGEPEVAIKHVERAMRLTPQDPQMVSMQTVMACSHLFCGRYAEAWRWSEMVVQRLPNYGFPICVAAASAALAGKTTEATSTMAHLRELMPEFCVSKLLGLFPIRRSVDFDTFAEGLRKAGLPE
jgi:TolB-like protein/class 3 adenylate cyclase